MYLKRKIDAFLCENSIYTFPYFCAFLLKRFMRNFHPEEDRAK